MNSKQQTTNRGTSPSHHFSSPCRKAFTGIEIVIAVAIVAVVTTMILVAANVVSKSVKHNQADTNLQSICVALEKYKAEFGEYPPDMLDDEDLVKHVKKRWPRFRLFDHKSMDSTLTPRQVTARHGNDIREAISKYMETHRAGYASRGWMGTNWQMDLGRNDSFEAAQCALVLWLGGLPDEEGKFRGFSAEPTAPFGKTVNVPPGNSTVVNNGGGGYPPTIDKFDEKTFLDLEIGKNVRLYRWEFEWPQSTLPVLMDNSFGKEVPILYFKATKGAGHLAYANFIPSPKDPWWHERLDNANLWPPDPGGFWPKAVNFTHCHQTTSEPVKEWFNYGNAVPYAKQGTIIGALFSSPTVEWFNPTSYQLIHPGEDGKFGLVDLNYSVRGFRVLNGPLAPGADPRTGLQPEDLDNLTNFSNFKPLKTLLP